MKRSISATSAVDRIQSAVPFGDAEQRGGVAFGDSDVFHDGNAPLFTADAAGAVLTLAMKSSTSLV